MNKGNVWILSGPSGSGKDTLIVKLLAAHPEIEFSISSITRPMRQGEKEGEKYHFLSREEFERMIEQDELLEYNEFVGNYYGTPRSPVEKAVQNGKDMLIEVDVNGAAQIRKRLPEAKSVFIMPPSLAELKRRLSGRGTEEPEVIQKRLDSAVEEIHRAVEYDYIVINGELSAALDELVAVLSGNRLRCENQKEIIEEVLSLC